MHTEESEAQTQTEGPQRLVDAQDVDTQTLLNAQNADTQTPPCKARAQIKRFQLMFEHDCELDERGDLITPLDVMQFGKYKETSYQWVTEQDYDYCQWCRFNASNPTLPLVRFCRYIDQVRTITIDGDYDAVTRLNAIPQDVWQAQIEEITADINSIADGHSEGHTDSDEHSEAADEATDVKDIDIDKEVAAHDDEAAPIDEHDFEDGLR